MVDMPAQTSLSLLLRDMREDGLSEKEENCSINVRNHCNIARPQIKI